jgi:hypothetical protein
MQDFIKMATAQLGVSETTGTQATKGVLGMLQNSMGGADFAQLTQALPGAGALLGGAPAGAAAGGGLGGMLGGALGGALGGGGAPAGGAGLGGMLGGMFGEAGSLAAIIELASSGLGKDQAGPFVQLFLDYVKKQGGQDILAKVLAAAPELAKLVG